MTFTDLLQIENVNEACRTQNAFILTGPHFHSVIVYVVATGKDLKFENESLSDIIIIIIIKLNLSCKW